MALTSNQPLHEPYKVEEISSVRRKTIRPQSSLCTLLASRPSDENHPPPATGTQVAEILLQLRSPLMHHVVLVGI